MRQPIFETVLECLSSPGFRDFLDSLREQAGEGAVELVELMYGSIDPLDGEMGRLNRIEFVGNLQAQQYGFAWNGTWSGYSSST